MKTIFTILLALITAVSFSQPESINYKALIKDGSNNIVANQNVTVLFTISKFDNFEEVDVAVYIEEHMTNTDTNGIVVLNIGEGNEISGGFHSIDWGRDRHFLNVQIDTGSGLTDMGTTEFMAVPYALYATNVSGLEAINEDNSYGWRLIGKSPDIYGTIGGGAVDLSQSWGTYPDTAGATGDNSFAVGLNTIASGQKSFASGVASNASGTQSTAMGARAFAAGHTSVSIGQGTKADSPNSTAMGILNVGGGDPLLASSIDPIFEIGNGYYSGGGTVENRNNAFSLLRNGNATLAGSLTQNSDRRLKTNITELQYGLNTILKLKPVSYNWEKYPEQKKKSIGLIAQEVQPIINEIVNVGIDKEKTLSLSYIELIPILIKAIQEQQEIINKQDTKINGLTAELEQLKTLDLRLNHLEALLNNSQQ